MEYKRNELPLEEKPIEHVFTSVVQVHKFGLRKVLEQPDYFDSYVTNKKDKLFYDYKPYKVFQWQYVLKSNNV